jgi:hypothetical protein
VNVTAHDSATCDPFSDFYSGGPDCQWQAQMAASCTYMSNFLNTGGGGSAEPPFISSLSPPSGTAGTTVHLSINGGGFYGPVSVGIADEFGNPAPINVSNISIPSAYQYNRRLYHPCGNATGTL